MSSHILFFRITLLFYFLGCVLFLLNLWDRRPVKEALAEDPSLKINPPPLPLSQRLAFFATGTGFLGHTAALLTRLNSTPFSNPQEALSFFSWVLVLIFFVIEVRYRVYVMGSFVLPLVFLSLLSVATMPHPNPPIAPSLTSALLGVHTTLSLLGIAAFAMAFVAGMMYLLQERFLKSKQFHALYEKLPSLDLLDQWNKTALFLGFPLLTLGIISGAVWSGYALGSLPLLNNPKTVLSIGAWFFYLIVLQGRLTIGWRAGRAARLSIAGFVGVLFIFFTLG